MSRLPRACALTLRGRPMAESVRPAIPIPIKSRRLQCEVIGHPRLFYGSCNLLMKKPTLSLHLQLQRNSSLPGNEIRLMQDIRLRFFPSAGYINDKLQDLFTHLFNGTFTGDYWSCVEVNDIWHTGCEP